METIDWWDRDFSPAPNAARLHPALTPSACRVSTSAGGDLIRRAPAAHPLFSPDRDQDGIPMGRLEIETGGRVTSPDGNHAAHHVSTPARGDRQAVSIKRPLVLCPQGLL